MIEPARLPPSVLVKIATLEAGCASLATRLETARRELQRLSNERRNTVPGVAYDPVSANQESERVLDAWATLDDAIEAQQTRIEALERRLRSEEAVIRSCKSYLHELPANARLRVIERAGGDLDAIRQRIDAVKDEIAQTQRIPVLSANLGSKIADHVADLAAKARPLIGGTADGESLRVLYPLHDHADRRTQSGFSPHEANALLLAALLDGKRLAEKLLQIATETAITANERDVRLHGLQEELTSLRYHEEAAICAALAKGFDAVRSSSMPAWSILMIEVEHEQKQAAA